MQELRLRQQSCPAKANRELAWTGAYNHLTVHFRLGTVSKSQASYLQSVTPRLKFQA